MKRYNLSLIVIFLALAIVPTASAHAPIGSGDNESLATATYVTDPTKSWAIYGELHEGGEAQYYKFDVTQGQRIHLTLLTTTAADDATFTPGLVLMGADLPSQGAVPSFVQTPPGVMLMSVDGTRPAQATYEAFAPSSYLQLAEISISAPASGTYYVAVPAADRGGHYGLAIGDRESFTLAEWLLNPLSLLTVYAWERQSLALVLTPALAAMAVGLILLVRRHRSGRRLDSISWLAAAAGLLYLGTGATVVSQMILSISRSTVDGFVIATLFFAILPIIFGLLAVRLAVRQTGRWTLRSRVYLLLLGGAGLLFWAGYLIGPALALAASVVPTHLPRVFVRQRLGTRPVA